MAGSQRSFLESSVGCSDDKESHMWGSGVQESSTVWYIDPEVQAIRPNLACESLREPGLPLGLPRVLLGLYRFVLSVVPHSVLVRRKIRRICQLQSYQRVKLQNLRVLQSRARSGIGSAFLSGVPRASWTVCCT